MSFIGERSFDDIPKSCPVIRRAHQAPLWICPQIHRVTHRIGRRFQQGYTSSISQANWCSIYPVLTQPSKGAGDET